MPRANPTSAGWALDTPAKGIVAISLILAIYAIAVTPFSPILVAVALDGIGVAAVAQALSDPSGTVSNTNGGPISGATTVLEQGPTAEGPFMRQSRLARGSSPTSTHKRPAITASSDGTSSATITRLRPQPMVATRRVTPPRRR